MISENRAHFKKSNENKKLVQVSGCEIFVGHVPVDASEKELVNYLSKYGKLVDFSMARDKDGFSKGFGFGKYSHREELELAVSQADHSFQGHPITVSKAAQTEDNRQKSSDEKDRKIFLKGIPKANRDFNEDTLSEYFCQFGAVESVLMPVVRPSLQRKGIAYILFKNKDSAEESLKSPIHLIDDFKISALKCTPKDAIKRKGSDDLEFANYREENKRFQASRNDQEGWISSQKQERKGFKKTETQRATNRNRTDNSIRYERIVDNPIGSGKGFKKKPEGDVGGWGTDYGPGGLPSQREDMKATHFRDQLMQVYIKVLDYEQNREDKQELQTELVKLKKMMDEDSHKNYLHKKDSKLKSLLWKILSVGLPEGEQAQAEEEPVHHEQGGYEDQMDYGWGPAEGQHHAMSYSHPNSNAWYDSRGYCQPYNGYPQHPMHPSYPQSHVPQYLNQPRHVYPMQHMGPIRPSYAFYTPTQQGPPRYAYQGPPRQPYQGTRMEENIHCPFQPPTQTEPRNNQNVQDQVRASQEPNPTMYLYSDESGESSVESPKEKNREDEDSEEKVSNPL